MLHVYLSHLLTALSHRRMFCVCMFTTNSFMLWFLLSKLFFSLKEKSVDKLSVTFSPERRLQVLITFNILTDQSQGETVTEEGAQPELLRTHMS